MNPVEELADLLRRSGMRPCFWFGRPPCPLCSGDHGDPRATAEEDRAMRDEMIRGLAAEVRRLNAVIEGADKKPGGGA